MAEFNRSLSTPAESRARSRNHSASCPRCRVDPSHAQRQFWEPARTAPPALQDAVFGPDLCRRSSRSYTSPASVHQFQHHPQRPATVGYHTGSGLVRYSSGDRDAWRVRGVLEPRPPPDVAPRRPESGLGHRLPDVTHTQPAVVHARTRSVPVGGSRAAVPPSSSFDAHFAAFDHQGPGHMVPRSTTQGILCPPRAQPDAPSQPSAGSSGTLATARHQGRHHQDALHSASNTLGRQWKRQQLTTNGVDPWVTTDRNNPQAARTLDRQLSADRNLNVSNQNSAAGSLTLTSSHLHQQQPQNGAGSSLTLTSSHLHQQQPQNNSSSSSNNAAPNGYNCWRPSTVSSSTSQSGLSPCPLPDLVTPRRQARKQCCGLLATHSVAIRWLVVVIAALGLLCSIVGTIVGVVKATGREHLTVALLLIGLGIVLVSMSLVAWKLTSRDSPSCRAMFGFRRTRHEPHRRFVPRVPHYGRPHPFSAMLYPDITLRPPPPSYQASMQEYRLRLLLMDRQPPPTHPPPSQPPPPPPPMYRGPATVYPRFPVNMGISDYSRPPSYRSRPGSSAGQPSPVGPEEGEPINSSTSGSIHLQNDVTPPAVAPQQRQAAPSTGGPANHVEVVARV